LKISLSASSRIFILPIRLRLIQKQAARKGIKQEEETMIRALLIQEHLCYGCSGRSASSGRSRFSETLAAAKGVFLLSDLVFVETMTLTKQRLGPPAAIRIGTN